MRTKKALVICLTKYVLIVSSFRGLQCDKGLRLGGNSEYADDYVHVYKPSGDFPFTPPPKNSNRFETNAFIWIVVTSIIIFIIILICCLAFFKISQKFSSVRHASRADLIAPTGSTQSLPNQQNGIRSGTRATNPYMRQVSRPPNESEDTPPDYTAVVTQSSHLRVHHLHQVGVVVDKKVETPPPAYITVAPFQ